MRCFNSFSELMADGVNNSDFSVFNDLTDVRSAAQLAADQAEVLLSTLGVYYGALDKLYSTPPDRSLVTKRDKTVKEVNDLNQIGPEQTQIVVEDIKKVNAAIEKEYQEIADCIAQDERVARQRLNDLMRYQRQLQKRNILGNKWLFNKDAFEVLPIPETLAAIAPVPSVSQQRFDSIEEAEKFYSDKPTQNECYGSFQALHNAANYSDALARIRSDYARKYQIERTNKDDGYATYDLAEPESLEAFTDRWVAGGGKAADAEYNYSLVYPEYKRGKAEKENAVERTKETVLGCIDAADEMDLQALPQFIQDAANVAGLDLTPTDVTAIDDAVEAGDLQAVKAVVTDRFVPDVEKPVQKRAFYPRQSQPNEYKFGVCVSGMHAVPELSEKLMDIAEGYADPSNPDLYETFTTLIRGVTTDLRKHERLGQDVAAATTGVAASRFVNLDMSKPLASQLHPELRGTDTADQIRRLDMRSEEIDNPERLQVMLAYFGESARALQPEDKQKVYEFFTELRESGVDIPGVPMDDFSVRRMLAMPYTKEQRAELMRGVR